MINVELVLELTCYVKRIQLLIINSKKQIEEVGYEPIVG